MMRNDSSSIISSLQMDYGDSDDEENDSKNSSRLNIEDKVVQSATEHQDLEDDVDSKVRDHVQLEIENNLSDEYNNNANEQNIQNSSEENEKDLETNEVKNEPEISPAELISDDEDSHLSHRHHRHHSPHFLDEKKQIISDALNTDSPSSQGSVKPGKKATRLVSYGPDEDVDESSSSSEDETEEIQEPVDSASPELNSADASILSRSVQNMSNDDIKIPPEPPGKCSAQLQKKIEEMYERMRRQELDLNRVIQNKKNFRNPSIYEKLIDYCHIDEKGTNFPPEIYDPHLWGKESFYDELDKIQRRDIEKREKEKKTKIEFISGTKKPVSSESSLGPPDEKKRKTKWDAQPANIIHVTKIPSSSQNPGVVSLTAMATGTKATVIPALGSLSKKTSSSSLK
ncbi:SAP30-binding protein [Bulinus truncatus]|nr:SAP30-binding protein [Bulinus truncatus]